MYTPIELSWKYLRYYLTAENGKGHGVHSPFVFELITRVLNDRRVDEDCRRIEALRRQRCRDNRMVEVLDLGAGSAHSKGQERSVASIAKHAAKSPRYGRLLHRIAAHYQPSTILELGTSLGFSTAYLATGNPGARVISLEGAPQILELARENFQTLNLTSIETIAGNFDDTLGPALEQLASPVDLAFVDGNHRFEPTVRYVDRLLRKTDNSSILILDDIHWSREMEAAWKACSGREEVSLSIDLFFIGLLVFRKEIREKQAFSIRF